MAKIKDGNDISTTIVVIVALLMGTIMALSFVNSSHRKTALEEELAYAKMVVEALSVQCGSSEEGAP